MSNKKTHAYRHKSYRTPEEREAQFNKLISTYGISLSTAINWLTQFAIDKQWIPIPNARNLPAFGERKDEKADDADDEEVHKSVGAGGETDDKSGDGKRPGEST